MPPSHRVIVPLKKIIAYVSSLINMLLFAIFTNVILSISLLLSSSLLPKKKKKSWIKSFLHSFLLGGGIINSWWRGNLNPKHLCHKIPIKLLSCNFFINRGKWPPFYKSQTTLALEFFIPGWHHYEHTWYDVDLLLLLISWVHDGSNYI